jgi:hypothetical protein
VDFSAAELTDKQEHAGHEQGGRLDRLQDDVGQMRMGATPRRTAQNAGRAPAQQRADPDQLRGQGGQRDDGRTEGGGRIAAHHGGDHDEAQEHLGRVEGAEDQPADAQSDLDGHARNLSGASMKEIARTIPNQTNVAATPIAAVLGLMERA